MKNLGIYESPFGLIEIGANDTRLESLRFVENYADSFQKNDSPIIDITRKWLDDYFNKKIPPIKNLQISFPHTSKFRECVWKSLLEIPYGKTMSYGELSKFVAEKLGVQKMSAQAIGSAVGANPIAIVVPCHRVIGANGKLSGYAYGAKIKRALLEHEGAF